MATLIKSLCLLSLLFQVCIVQPSHAFFNPFDPFGFFRSINRGNGEDTPVEGFGGNEGIPSDGFNPIPIDDGGNRGNGLNAGNGDAAGIGGNPGKELIPENQVVVGNEIQTAYKGKWEVVCENSGVSAMHLQLLPTNKIIMFDSTVFGPSQIPLPGDMDCRPVPGWAYLMDCWAHAAEYDIETADIRPLKVLTDTWCSSGGLNAEGTLVQTGGWNDGGKVVRFLKPCENCDWEEHPEALTGQRWYATQEKLPDGSFIIVGGRRMFNVEFVPANGLPDGRNYPLQLLRETTDLAENNLYPFVHLSPDGNVFILANNRAILFDPNTKTVVREFPKLDGGARNYPGSGMSVLLPINLHNLKFKRYNAEVLVCGGAPPEAYDYAEKQNKFLPALRNCGRIWITNEQAYWNMETMPSPRVMGDMLILPTADIFITNGAKKGSSGWQFADEPNFTPVIYRPSRPRAERFIELQPTQIARMYHSSSAVLPDGRILIAGSNTNNMYNFTGVKFPTEMRVEKFSPPYLDPALQLQRPVIRAIYKQITYGQRMDIDIHLNAPGVQDADMKVTMYAPPFTTHGYSMNQRMLILEIQRVSGFVPGYKTISVVAPPTRELAPPGYYLIFAVYRGLPSKGEWIKLG